MANAAQEPLKIVLSDIDGTLTNNVPIASALIDPFLNNENANLAEPSYNTRLIPILNDANEVFLVTDRELNTLNEAAFIYPENIKKAFAIKTIFNECAKNNGGKPIYLASVYTKLTQGAAGSWAADDGFKDEIFLAGDATVLPGVDAVAENPKHGYKYHQNCQYEQNTQKQKLPRFYAIIAKMHEKHPDQIFNFECYDDTPGIKDEFQSAVDRYIALNPYKHRINSAKFFAVN